MSFFISPDSSKSTCDESSFELVLLQVQNSACFLSSVTFIWSGFALPNVHLGAFARWNSYGNREGQQVRIAALDASICFDKMWMSSWAHRILSRRHTSTWRCHWKRHLPSSVGIYWVGFTLFFYVVNCSRCHGKTNFQIWRRWWLECEVLIIGWLVLDAKICISGNSPYFCHRLLILSILSNETPFASDPVIDKNTGNIRIPQNETLVTIQDWLWHKLLVIYGIPVVVGLLCSKWNGLPPYSRSEWGISARRIETPYSWMRFGALWSSWNSTFHICREFDHRGMLARISGISSSPEFAYIRGESEYDVVLVQRMSRCVSWCLRNVCDACRPAAVGSH